MAQHSRRALVIAGGFGVPPAEEVDPAADGRLSLKNLERLPAREVPAAALSAGVYLRQGGTRAAHVQALIEAAESGELPPVLVQQDGWRVIDGLHRLEAARTRGDRLVRARFVDCTDSEALVLAMAANSAHGLPLARPDRVAGARHVLAAHPDWSDRAIAAISGLSAGTIAALRERPADGERDTGKRLGRDGRRRPVAAGEGRRRAAEYISAHPDAPLRQVARETDVSLGTVHDVSVRLRRGAAPETGGRPAPRPVRAVPPPAPAPAALSPGGAVPGGTVPGGTIPGGAVPGGTIPGGTVPGGTVPGAPARFPAARPLPAPGPRQAPGPHPAARPLPGPPSAPPPGPARRGAAGRPAPAWSGIAAKVAADPSVRYSQGGKEFMQWMTLHASDPARWREFLASIPPHWLSVIAPIADSISKEWAQFARQLATQQEGAQ